MPSTNSSGNSVGMKLFRSGMKNCQISFTNISRELTCFKASRDTLVLYSIGKVVGLYFHLKEIQLYHQQT